MHPRWQASQIETVIASLVPLDLIVTLHACDKHDPLESVQTSILRESCSALTAKLTIEVLTKNMQLVPLRCFHPGAAQTGVANVK